MSVSYKRAAEQQMIKTQSLNLQSEREEKCVAHNADAMTLSDEELAEWRKRKVALITGISGQVSAFTQVERA